MTTRAKRRSWSVLGPEPTLMAQRTEVVTCVLELTFSLTVSLSPSKHVYSAVLVIAIHVLCATVSRNESVVFQSMCCGSPTRSFLQTRV